MLVELLVATAVASSYVAVIKVAQPASLKGTSRNSPAMIHHRILRVSLLCCGLLILLPPVLVYGLRSYADIASVVRQFGVLPGFTNSGDLLTDLTSVGEAVSKMAVLYVGPISLYVFVERKNLAMDLQREFATLSGFRNHVFAPITEEFVYRAAVLAVLKPVMQARSLVMYSPLLFGVAHAHHGFTLYADEGWSAGEAAVATAFQLVYTTLFGMLANSFYLRSQCNMWSAVAVHAMCNLLGFPDVAVRREHPRFFYVYCVLLVAGAVGFWRVF